MTGQTKTVPLHIEGTQEELTCGFTAHQVTMIRGLIKDTYTESEFHTFLHICQRSQLDPLAKQIYAISRSGKLTTQTSIDGFRLIAERTGRYAPGRSTEYMYDESRQLIGATAFVKKCTNDGTWHEVSNMALISEYSPQMKGNWSKMPHIMIAKCAESLALRRAFPADLSGLYTSEEMDQADGQKTKVTKATEDPVLSLSDEVITKEQEQELVGLLNGYDGVKQQLLDKHKIKLIGELPALHFNHCKKVINTFLDEKKKPLNQGPYTQG